MPGCLKCTIVHLKFLEGRQTRCLQQVICPGVKNALDPKSLERRKLPSFCADVFRSYPRASARTSLLNGALQCRFGKVLPLATLPGQA